MSARALCRQHGAPYLRPSAGRERLAGICGALLLTACLTLPGALIDTEETDVNPFPEVTPFSEAKPASDDQPLTTEELALYLRARRPHREFLPTGDEFPEPHMPPAECCTDVGAEPAGRHRSTWIYRVWQRLQRSLS